MNPIQAARGQLRIPGPEGKDALAGRTPEPWLVPFYERFEHRGFEFVVIDVQVADSPQVTDGRFGYTIVERRTGMGAKSVCELSVAGALLKGREACEKNWSDRVEAALRTWKVLNP